MTVLTFDTTPRPLAAPGFGGERGSDTTGWFEADLRPHLHTLYQRARQLTADAEAADDLLQDTLERAYRKRALFQHGTDLRAWLFCIMRNIWISSHRRRAAEPGTVSLDALDEVTLDRRAARDAPGPSSVVESSVVDGLGETAILGVIATLPPPFREIVMLADVNDTPYKTIAEALQIPIGSVCSRLSRARQRLRHELRERGHDLEELARTA